MNNPFGTNGSYLDSNNFFDIDLLQSPSMWSHKLQLADIKRSILFANCSTIPEQLQELKESSATNNKNFIELKAKLMFQIKRHFLYYEKLQGMVITELRKWRHQQALAANGALFSEQTLDDIQRCFELLETFINQLLTTIDDIPQAEDPELTALHENMQRAQKNLQGSALIVVKQPPQVMRTNTKFAVSVRWLLGSQLELKVKPPIVKCTIVSEFQAKHFVAHQGPQLDMTKRSLAELSSGELQNSTNLMEYQPTKQIFCANFRNMLLKCIRRSNKQRSQCVMDEKFALFFYATTILNGIEVCSWTFSLPVVVIVHGNQEPQSWATITWDNAFAEVVRDPFVVTQHVTWSELSMALNTRFGFCTQRELTPDNLQFLHEKLKDKSMEYITWQQFCKQPLPQRSFTFWDWFYAIMKLTKDHLLPLWQANRIVGFISKSKAQQQLLRSDSGTFLLRFSDSELGAISIAYVNEVGSITMLSPWTGRDLQIISLADRIRDLPMLRHLQSTASVEACLDRDVAFGQFYTQPAEEAARADGYVASTIHVQIPDCNTSHSMLDYMMDMDMECADDPQLVKWLTNHVDET